MKIKPAELKKQCVSSRYRCPFIPWAEKTIYITDYDDLKRVLIGKAKPLPRRTLDSIARQSQGRAGPESEYTNLRQELKGYIPSVTLPRTLL